MIPINKVLKENKNKISNIVNEKPKIGSKNNLLIIIKMKKIPVDINENKPTFVIMLTGAPVDDNSESMPYLINQPIEDFDLPLFLMGRSNNMPVCLKPIYEIKPRKNLILSLIVVRMFFIFLSIIL